MFISCCFLFITLILNLRLCYSVTITTNKKNKGVKKWLDPIYYLQIQKARWRNTNKNETSHRLGLGTPRKHQHKPSSPSFSCSWQTVKFVCGHLIWCNTWVCRLLITRCSGTVWVWGWCSWTEAPETAACRRTGFARRKHDRKTYSSGTCRTPNKHH